MNQLLKKITKEQYLLLISIIPIILLVLVSLFNSNVQNRNEINNELIQSVECKLYKNQINQLIESDNIIIYKNYNLELRSNFKNISCLGKLMNVETGESNIFYIGTSSIISVILFFIINTIFIINCYKIQNYQKQTINVISFVIYNYLTNYFFNQNILDYRFLITAHTDALFDASQLNPTVINPTENNIFMYFLFITVFVSKINNKYLTSFSFIFFIFYQIEFIPFLFLFNYLINKNDLNNESLFRKYSMVSTVALFYIVRIVSGFWFNPSTNHWWVTTGQRIYLGFNRYDDLRKNLYGAWCVNKDIPECYLESGLRYLPGGGPLEKFLAFNGDVLIATRNLASLALISVLIIYFFIIFKLKNDWYIVSFLFLSPPLNFLTFLLNVDLLLLLISLFCLINYKKFPFFFSSIIFILSLYKLHIMGILLGLIFYSHKLKERKIFILNSILFISSFAIFVIDKLINDSPVALATVWVQTYGFLNTAAVLERNLNIDWRLLYIVIFLIFIAVTFSNKLNSIYNDIKFKNFIDSYLMYGMLFWFLPTILYTNHVYRFPLFYILFFYLFKNSNTKVKWILFFSLSLNPALYTVDFISNGLLILNNISIVLLFAIFSKYVYINHVKLFLIKFIQLPNFLR